MSGDQKINAKTAMRPSQTGGLSLAGLAFQPRAPDLALKEISMQVLSPILDTHARHVYIKGL